MNDADILVSAPEAAAWTGRKTGTIWRWASEGRISRAIDPLTGQTKYLLSELDPKTADGPGETPPKRKEQPNG